MFILQLASVKLYFDRYIVMYSPSQHHRHSLSSLKKPRVLHLLTPAWGPLAATGLSYHLYSRAFSRMSYEWNQTVWSLSDCLLSLSKMHLSFRRVLWPLARASYPSQFSLVHILFGLTYSTISFVKAKTQLSFKRLIFILSPVPSRLKKE